MTTTKISKVTIDAVRAQAVNHSLFTTKSVGDAVKRLGFVQADPIQAPARAQDLILRQRMKDYRAGDLERRYPKLKLDEEVLHVYGYMPSSLVSMLHPRPGRRIDREHPTLADGILDFVKSNGLTSHRDLEQHFGSMRVRGDWGNQAKATTLVLDSLHYRGHVRVAHRNGNERFYTVVDREACALSPTERLRELVMVLMGLYAPMSLPGLRMLVSRLGYGAPSLDGRRTIVKELLATGELVQAEVEGMPYFWPAKTKFDQRDDGPSATTRTIRPNRLRPRALRASVGLAISLRGVYACGQTQVGVLRAAHAVAASRRGLGECVRGRRQDAHPTWLRQRSANRQGISPSTGGRIGAHASFFLELQTSSAPKQENHVHPNSIRTFHQSTLRVTG